MNLKYPLFYVDKMQKEDVRLQWNPEMRTLTGPTSSVLIIEVSFIQGLELFIITMMAHLLVCGLRSIEVYAIQRCNKCIVNVSFLGPRDSVLFIEVSVFQGVRISGFHCIGNVMPCLRV